MDAMAEGLVDAAVVVCEGAGTVAVARPEVLQAVGAHMTGLVKTEPIKEIQDGLEDEGMLSSRTKQIKNFHFIEKAEWLVE